MNLYEEVVIVLKKYEKTVNDIKFISLKEKSVDINQFLQIAKVTIYDNGFGLPEIDESLMIVGDDWWLERHSYDGTEWFEFKRLPSMPNEKIEVLAKVDLESN